jgi:hypothetical protein
MKKVILFCAFTCITFLAFSQKFTNQQIVDILNKSMEVNKLTNGVYDKDFIYPDKQLTFISMNGGQIVFPIKKGDNMWILGTEALKYQAAHPENPIINPSQGINDQQPAKGKNPNVDTVSAKTDWMLLWILLASVGVIAVAIWISRLVRKHKMEAKKDPVTSGPAMRPGGITDENALAYATQVAGRQFNNPNLQVREVQRGMLSGENLEVFYAGNATPQRRTFTNQPAYRGIVNLNGADQFVYFLQGCGNDVRMGNYFTGQNIQFNVDAAAPVLRPQPTTTTEQSTPAQETQPIMQMVKVMVEALKDKASGKMTITNVDGVKVEMFFSTGPISFSSNGNAENAIKLEEKSHVQ